jgi:hypothetical protein
MNATNPALFEAAVGDEMYNHLKNPEPGASEYLVRGQEFAKQLWARTREYLDRDLPEKAALHFHQAFWEMYLAAALLDLGLPLVPRSQRKKAGLGPDLQIAPNIWIEAIAVTAGSGPDAVPVYNDSKVHDVPEVPLRLRIVSGVCEKRNKFKTYLEKGIVAPSDICVVAINTAMLPIYGDFFPPRVVRALMEFGWPQVTIDLQSRSVVERGHSHEPNVKKLSGNAVEQGLFRNGSCGCLSACVWSAASYASAGYPPGHDFVVVHNPTAAAPLTRELINCGDECWIDGESLSYKRHRETAE